MHARQIKEELDELGLKRQRLIEKKRRVPSAAKLTIKICRRNRTQSLTGTSELISRIKIWVPEASYIRQSWPWKLWFAGMIYRIKH